MGNENSRGLASMNLSTEKQNEIYARCFNMVDYLNEAAVDIIMDLFQNSVCAVSKQLIKNHPEVIAVRAFEKVINDLKEMAHRPDVPLN